MKIKRLEDIIKAKKSILYKAREEVIRLDAELDILYNHLHKEYKKRKLES